MSNVQPKVENCHLCRQGTARPRVIETRYGNKIITEAKWVCPICGRLFKTGVVSERVLETANTNK